MTKKLSKKQEYSLDILKSYQKIFETPDGKRVLFDIMNEGGFLSSTHYQGDPYETAFLEGKRFIVLFILKKLEMDHNKVRELIEQKTKEERNVYS